MATLFDQYLKRFKTYKKVSVDTTAVEKNLKNSNIVLIKGKCA